MNAGQLTPLWTRAEYGARVARIHEHLRAGEVYQVNLAQRLVARIDDEGALALYLALRKRRAGAARRVPRDRSAAARCSPNTPERLLRVGDAPKRSTARYERRAPRRGRSRARSHAGSGRRRATWRRLAR